MRVKLPNAQDAVVEIRKLSQYCLSLEHPEGKHKARLFATALGRDSRCDAPELRVALLQAAETNEVRLGRRDDYGQRYTIDFLFEWRGKQATIRSGWIIEHDSDVPRLTSCYPLL